VPVEVLISEYGPIGCWFWPMTYSTTQHSHSQKAIWSFSERQEKNRINKCHIDFNRNLHLRSFFFLFFILRPLFLHSAHFSWGSKTHSRLGCRICINYRKTEFENTIPLGKSDGFHTCKISWVESRSFIRKSERKRI
jgi:hypothetical protein